MALVASLWGSQPGCGADTGEGETVWHTRTAKEEAGGGLEHPESEQGTSGVSKER